MAFIHKYYLYFLGALVVFVLGLIGYLVDSYKTDKYRKAKTIKKEIKKDVPKIKEASNEIIDNLNLDELENKTISSLQKEHQNVSSQNPAPAPAKAEAPVQNNAQIPAANNEENVLSNRQNPNNTV